MKDNIKALISELKSENNDRAIAMNDRECSDYSYTTLVNRYNNTLDIIKRLEKIVKYYEYK